MNLITVDTDRIVNPKHVTSIHIKEETFRPGGYNEMARQNWFVVRLCLEGGEVLTWNYEYVPNDCCDYEYRARKFKDHDEAIQYKQAQQKMKELQKLIYEEDISGF